MQKDKYSNVAELPRMVNLTFLDAVAKGYVENYEDLSEICFVFPNKRSGTFFIRSLSRFLDGRTALGPEVVSITDFVETVSRRDTATRLDLLFRLYNIYKKLKRKKSPDPVSDLLDFDSFRSWGEIVLSDFSEVDQYMVDPDAVFKNVKDYKDIASNFLSEDQIKILERYFGFTPNQKDVHRFWKNVDPGQNESKIKTRFLQLWELLIPLYHALDKSLADQGLATSGGVYRAAVRRLREEGRDALRWEKVVLVGFNALSTSEALLFEELYKLGTDENPYADFYWDSTGPVLNSGGNDASSFLRLNRKNFPSPEWAERYLKECEASTMPHKIEVIASPSNSAQTKIGGNLVKELLTSLGEENINSAKVAVVLPDENLLLPLLHALPEDIGKINLTMGYSLKYTSASTFMHHLRRLHVRARKSKDGETLFYSEDVRMLLSHPFVHYLIGSGMVAQLNSFLDRGHKISVSYSDLRKEGGDVLEFLDVKDYTDDTEGVITYLDDLLVRVDVSLAGGDTGVVKSRIDRTHIARYRDSLRNLKYSAEEHGIKLGFAGVFYMVDRLLSGEKITFEGEPLEGLQIMGLLETRALDFEHLIVLSMNDKIMPRKSRHATFIPESLRRGYGLPSANYQERLFAYYFYRMISRAKSVSLVYDARSGEGMRSGGESRYIMQLRYLFAKNNLHETKYRFRLSNSKHIARPVVKTEEIMSRIKEYAVEGSGYNFSASALKKYGECQVKFYYEVIARLVTDPQSTVFIDPITQGNIVHETMLCLYVPPLLRRKYLPAKLRITADIIGELLKSPEKIEEEVRKAVCRQFYGYKEGQEPDKVLEGSVAMTARHIVEQVKDILSYDWSLAPFDLAGGEMEGLYRYEYAAGKKVNMKYAIDRLDIVNPDMKNEQWRIVDYKTGDSHVEAAEFDDIFNGDYKARNIFQLMLYANLMNLDLGKDENVRVSIYQVDTLLKNGEVLPTVGGVRNTVTGHKEINDEFIARLNSILADIFDKDKSFEPTDDEDNCRLCRLKQLCGKE